MKRVKVLTFVEFRLKTSAEFGTVAEADAYAHGIRHGFTLAGGHAAIYVAVLPRDLHEMQDIIPAAELERAYTETR